MEYLDYPGLQRFKNWLDRTYLKVLPDNWTQINAAVKSGAAPGLLPVGAQIADKWERDVGASYDAPWDVVYHHENGDMELNWHYSFPDGVPFDEPEAIYYAPAGGLAAGQYYITIGSAYGNGWATTKHINFTLSTAMEEGDQLFIDCGKDKDNDPTNGRTWNVYAQGSTTSKQNGTTSDGTTGTELGTIGNVSAQKTNGNLNAISRVIFGSGRWKESAIRQWLNSAAAAGSWWTPQNGWDRPSSVHSTLRGFLAGFSEDFLSILEAVDVVTALNTQEGFSDDTEITQDKIYLPCLENWYINPEKSGEGAEWDYYKALADEAGISGMFQRNSTYEILKNFTWYVSSSGKSDNYYASSARFGCPACKIKKST